MNCNVRNQQKLCNVGQATKQAHEVSEKLVEEKVAEKEHLKEAVAVAESKVEQMAVVNEMYAAKWLGQKEILFDSVHQSRPKTMLKGIHGLLKSLYGLVAGLNFTQKVTLYPSKHSFDLRSVSLRSSICFSSA